MYSLVVTSSQSDHEIASEELKFHYDYDSLDLFVSFMCMLNCVLMLNVEKHFVSSQIETMVKLPRF